MSSFECDLRFIVQRAGKHQGAVDTTVPITQKGTWTAMANLRRSAESACFAGFHLAPCGNNEAYQDKKWSTSPHGPHLRIETVGTSHPQTSRKIAPGAEFGWVRNLSNFVCPIKKMALNEGYGHQQFSYRWFYSHPKSVAPEAHIEAS